MKPTCTAITIFVLSVAEDDSLLKQFCRHLQILEREGLIIVQHRLSWLAGSDWRQQFNEQLGRATIILPLLSADFLASYEMYHDWLPYLLARADADEAYVFPVLLRPVDYQSALFLHFSLLPDRRMPITTWHNQDEAFAWIIHYLRTVIEGIPDQAKQLPPLPPILQRPPLFMAPDLPSHFVVRKDEFEQLKQSILMKSRDQPIAITTALRGTGGYGKTTLAQALCHDPEIQATFQDGILWVTLGKQAEVSLTTRLEDLIVLLTGKRPEVTNRESMTAAWRGVLADRSCLLVIDDVWHSHDLKPFLEGGSHCVRLITTRNDAVLPANTSRILVDAMQLGEAIELLLIGLNLGTATHEILHTARQLAERLGKWPLLLNLANGVVRRHVRHGESIEKAFLYLHLALDKKGVIAFDERNVRERDEAVSRTLEISIEQLEHADITRYKELAIFPKNTDIPLVTVQQLWQATGDCDELDAKDLCLLLADLSLLLTCNLQHHFIRIHDVIHDYLHTQVKTHLSSMHQQFLGAYHQEKWANLAHDEPYLWDYLAYHLLAAEKYEILVETFKDLHYLAAKILVRGTIAVERDLSIVSNQMPILHELRRYIMRLAYLQAAQHEADIETTIMVHMYGYEQLKPLYEIWEHEIMRSWIGVWHPLPGTESQALLRTILGHRGSVTHCAISPDGSWVLSVSSDRTLKIWDSHSGQKLHTLQGHRGSVTHYAISSDGSWVLSASSDGTLKIWDSHSGQKLHTLQGHERSVTHCAISPDGSWVLSASSDGTLKIWDSHSGQKLHTLQGHERSVTYCAISPDGSWVLSASEDKTFKIWDSDSGQILRSLQVYKHNIRCYAISPDGSWLVATSNYGILKIWDSHSGQELHTLQGHERSITHCAISPDGDWVLSASSDGTLKIWDSHSGQELHTFQGYERSVTYCVISPDGDWVLSASSDGTLKIWDSHSGQEQCTLLGHRGRVTCCAISPDGSWVLSSSADHTLKIWDSHSGREQCTLGHRGRVTCCAISPDGSWVLSASNDGTLKIWDSNSGQILRTFQKHGSDVACCAISPDGTWLVSASSDGVFRIQDSRSGKKLYNRQSSHKKSVVHCAISPDGTWFVSASSDGTLKIWDSHSGQKLRTLQGYKGRATCCAISPDGTWFVSGFSDGTLKIWDSHSGREQCTLLGHRGRVTCCAISPDGTWVLSSSADHTLKIWDSRSGNTITTLHFDDVLTCCLCHPDGTSILAGGYKGVYFLRFIRSNT